MINAHDFSCRRINAHDLHSTMSELGMTLTTDDVTAMMSQAGVGPEGMLFFKGSQKQLPHVLQNLAITYVLKVKY